MSTATDSRAGTAAGTRDLSLDVLRGLAVVLMIGDHLSLMLGLELYRDTLGRAAMPLFFVIAGHLASRVTSRHAYVLAAGAALPVAVPWIDNPNVLVLYVLGVVVLELARVAGLPRWVLVAGALTVSANGWSHSAGYYDPTALVGLMALGRLMPRSAFRVLPLTLALARGRRTAGTRAGLLLGRVGRAPLRWYVGHLLVLEALRLLTYGGTS